MKKFTLFIFLFSNLVFSQTIEENLHSDLGKFRFFFLNGILDKMYDFTYDSKTTNKENWIKKGNLSFQELDKTKWKIKNVYYKDFNEIIQYKGELQTSFTEALILDSPEGRYILEDTNIGISNDKGKTWKFINTGKDNNKFIHKQFPNLSNEIIVKPIYKKLIDENILMEKCREYKNLELTSITSIGLKKLKISIKEEEKKDISDDGSFYLIKIIRNSENPCKIDEEIKEIYNKPNSKFKIGDILHTEIINYEEGNYYFISIQDKNPSIISYQSKVLK